MVVAAGGAGEAVAVAGRFWLRTTRWTVWPSPISERKMGILAQFSGGKLEESGIFRVSDASRARQTRFFLIFNIQ